MLREFSRPIHRAIDRPIDRPLTGLSAGVVVPPPAALTEYWVAGSGLLTTGDVPVTSAGQSITKWVGQKLGTVLTCTDIIADMVAGRLVPKSNSGRMQLPITFSQNRRDLTVLMHVQRPGAFQTRYYFGFDKDSRACEMGNYGSIRTYTYDGVTQILHLCTGKASPCTISFRSNATNRRPGINGSEILAAAMAAGTMLGGSFCSLQDGTVQSSDRVYAIGVAPYLSDTDFGLGLDWCNSIRTRPSETAPKYNIGVYGDSQTEGLNSGGHSWLLDVADSYDARIIPAVGSAQYFALGGNPQNAADELTRMQAEKVTGATRNIVLFCTTNDFNNVANGSAYFSAVKTAGLAFMAAGWEAWVAKHPHRAAPYTSTDTTYNPNVDEFNALHVTDPWMTGSVDLTSLENYLLSDGIHWTSAGQTVAKGLVATALGLS